MGDPHEQAHEGSAPLKDERSAERERSRYEERGELGRGGMGIVWRVFDPKLEREIAMKVLREFELDAAATEEDRRIIDEQRRRFIEEAKVTGQLDHPGVVAVHELGGDGSNCPYFTMRLVKGRDLREIFALAKGEKERWTNFRALQVLLRVCEILAFAHAKGVVHRDLKPSNVMVGRFGETYVMDWGLAKAMGRKDPHDIRVRIEPAGPLSTVRTSARRGDGDPDSPLVTMDGAIVGTAAYMSPEQANGNITEVGFRSDVYAVGAMLYHLLAGHPPYLPPGTVVPKYTLLGLVQQGPPPRILAVNPNVDVELAAICEKAMSRDPRKRYADTMELAADLEAFLGHRPIAARPPSVFHVLALAFQRNRGIAWTAAAAVGVLGIFAVVFLLRLSHAAEETRLADAQKQIVADALAAAALVEAEKTSLRPRMPEAIPETTAWLSRVDDLLARRASLASGGGSHAAVPPLLDGEANSFRANLAALGVRRADVAGALESARTLDARTVLAPDAREAWEQAIAEVGRSAKYGGLALTSQVGLVPIGWNEFGLWEFWVASSGERPEPHTGDVRLYTVRPQDGIVLVLLPGARVTLGDPRRMPTMRSITALHEADVPPLFMGKHEVTQAQWERVMRRNPSRYRQGTEEMRGQDASTHPVEYVTWNDCERFCARLGLALPTQDQWEYACRAGSREAYAFGSDASCLQGFENVQDAVYDKSIFKDVADWRDGFRYHSAVGTFRPNGFGLLDMHGNVSEWCGDRFDDGDAETSRRSTSDDMRRPPERIIRGGSFYLGPSLCVAAYCQHDLEYGANQTRGLRVVRGIDR